MLLLKHNSTSYHYIIYADYLFIIIFINQRWHTLICMVLQYQSRFLRAWNPHSGTSNSWGICPSPQLSDRHNSGSCYQLNNKSITCHIPNSTIGSKHFLDVASLNREECGFRSHTEPTEVGFVGVGEEDRCTFRQIEVNYFFPFEVISYDLGRFTVDKSLLDQLV